MGNLNGRVSCTGAIAHQGHNSKPSPSPTAIESTPAVPSESSVEVSPAIAPTQVVPTAPPIQGSMMPLFGESIFVLLVATPFLLLALRRTLSEAE